jgi:adenylyltransferase/sulfurtransferase
MADRNEKYVRNLEAAMNLERYARQITYEKIGTEGQRKILAARVAVIGIGALGTVIANNLCRAGVGCLRLIDRDYVELSNLQRQVLFDEEDAAAEIPKAEAACDHLSKINAEVKLEPVAVHVDSSNIEGLIKDIDVVLDGSDNMELRFLINEACHKLKKPWVHGGVIGAAGNCMTILPGQSPCFRCLVPEIPPAGSYPTCASAGVLNMASNIIASMESAEALKIITGSPDVNRRLFVLDVWNNTAEHLELSKNPDCPVCGRSSYEMLVSRNDTHAVSLCGRDEYQIIPGHEANIDLGEFETRLSAAGTVKRSRFMLSFSNGKTGFNLFPDGRAIIKNVKDEKAARSVYSEYIGL